VKKSVPTEWMFLPHIQSCLCTSVAHW